MRMRIFDWDKNGFRPPGLDDHVISIERYIDSSILSALQKSLTISVISLRKCHFLSIYEKNVHDNFLSTTFLTLELIPIDSCT